MRQESAASNEAESPPRRLRRTRCPGGAAPAEGSMGGRKTFYQDDESLEPLPARADPSRAEVIGVREDEAVIGARGA